jgi:arginase
MRTVQGFGIASCVAARDGGCSLGPSVFRNSTDARALLDSLGVHLDWKPLVTPPPGADPPETVRAVCDRIGRLIRTRVAAYRSFVCVGGDHSSAMGIWGGAMQALSSPADLGLIWIDAHMDAHRFETSPSGNLHGMPVAALLGQGDPPLRRVYGDRPVLPPENLVLVGVRAFEPEERDLLERLRVPVHYMRDDLDDRLGTLLQDTFDRLARRCARVGVSIDLDAIDPEDAPGTGIPVPGGLRGATLCSALSRLNGEPPLLGLEIAEFKPSADPDGRTGRLVARLIGALYGDRNRP